MPIYHGNLTCGNYYGPARITQWIHVLYIVFSKTGKTVENKIFLWPPNIVSLLKLLSYVLENVKHMTANLYFSSFAKLEMIHKILRYSVLFVSKLLFLSETEIFVKYCFCEINDKLIK